MPARAQSLPFSKGSHIVTADDLTAAEGEPKDVWTRSGSKYRVRAVVLLAVNVLLFAGVGCFAFWLRSGRALAPTMDSYCDQLASTFQFTGTGGKSLGSLLLEPISVLDVPMQIPILGLLMAALIAIPILVSMLYRFWASLPFIAVTGFLAVMPWLAITLLGSCILASCRPFRTRFRFMSALLGLVPTVIYLILAWRGSNEAYAGYVDPVDRIKFIAPWVLAIVAATLVFVIVLIIAKVVDYRPGAITPLLAIMFCLPVLLFEYRVGRDELHYRLLESLNRAHFADIDASVPLKVAARNRWDRLPLPRPSFEQVYEFQEITWQFALNADTAAQDFVLTHHQQEIVTRCDWFHRYFPTSRYVLNALFIKARALDMRIDPREFRENKWIRFYDDFPSCASRSTWRAIAANDAGSILGAVAALRLAQLDAAAGEVERAVDRLHTTLSRFSDHRPAAAVASQAPPDKGVLARERPEAELHIPFDRILIETRRLHDLLASNRDPIYGYDPVSGPAHRAEPLSYGLMDVIPRSIQYIPRLQAIKAAYPNCQLMDNLDLEIAKATPSIADRVRLLNACISDHPRGDALPEALYRLAVAYKQSQQISASDAAIARLLADYPDSLWADVGAAYAPWLSEIHLSEARQ